MAVVNKASPFWFFCMCPHTLATPNNQRDEELRLTTHMPLCCYGSMIDLPPRFVFRRKSPRPGGPHAANIYRDRINAAVSERESCHLYSANPPYGMDKSYLALRSSSTISLPKAQQVSKKSHMSLRPRPDHVVCSSSAASRVKSRVRGSRLGGVSSRPNHFVFNKPTRV